MQVAAHDHRDHVWGNRNPAKLDLDADARVGQTTQQRRVPYYSGMTAAHAHELPPESGGELVLTSDEVAAVERDGEIVILTRAGRPVAKVHAIDPDQAWFWTPEWQAKEREVEEERAAGIPDQEFDSGEEFLDYLEAVIADPSKL